MSYQVLARKWRPRSFREMVGQEHVLKALINALDHNRLHHAYLFTGTRGVGKTTIARILAKCLNCETGVSSEPCGQCSACTEIGQGRFVDLIEVDAASRTKVEDTRELLDNVQYAPTRGRYKIYLIDEVHMLSNHSFNALLKTLEEPPEHVKFLLATTDPQKLPVTILSRCLQFNLKNMSPERIVGHLQHVLTKEMVPYDDAGLWLLARSADGSMRDALSLTDQAISFGGGKVGEMDVSSMLGTIDHQLVQAIIEALVKSDGKSILQAVAQFSEHAPDYSAALADLLTLLHRIAIAQALPEALDNSFGDREQVLQFAMQLPAEDVQLFYQTALIGRRDLPLASDPRSGFEMTLLRMLAFKPQGVAEVPTRSLPANAPANTTAGNETASVEKSSPQPSNDSSIDNDSGHNNGAAAGGGNVAQDSSSQTSSPPLEQPHASAPEVNTSNAAVSELSTPASQSDEIVPDNSMTADHGLNHNSPPVPEPVAYDNSLSESSTGENLAKESLANQNLVDQSPVSENTVEGAVGQEVIETEKKHVADTGKHDSSEAQAIATLSEGPASDGVAALSHQIEAAQPGDSSSAPNTQAIVNNDVTATNATGESVETGYDDVEQNISAVKRLISEETADDSKTALQQQLKDQVKAIVGKEGLTADRKKDVESVNQTAPEPTIAQDIIALSDFLPEHWISVYRHLDIRGILQSTAANCVCMGRESNILYFLLDDSKASLFDESHKQRLTGIFTDYFGEPVRLEVNMGMIPEGVETPAMCAERERLEKYHQVLADFKVDPVVNTLMSEFGATFDEQSIIIK